MDVASECHVPTFWPTAVGVAVGGASVGGGVGAAGGTGAVPPGRAGGASVDVGRWDGRAEAARAAPPPPPPTSW